jgi:hypothetical protein
MGFYYRSARRRPSTHDDGFVVTPGEFTTIVSGALCAVIGTGGSDTYRPGVADPAGVSARLANLSARLRRNPGDAEGHRMLGIAYLSVGSRKPAIRHLEIAINILQGLSVAGGSLHSTLRARLELTLLVPILVPLYLRLGKSGKVRRFLSEVLLAW